MDIKFNNPLSESWYADPEARFYEGKYCIYVTRSLPYDEQLNHDMFVSDDLEHWEIKKDIIDKSKATEYKEGNKTAVIPAGFTVSKAEGRKLYLS